MFDRKTADGYICTDCFSYIPTVINYKDCSQIRLDRMIEKNKEYRKRFTTTTSFGSLFLDNVHKMFCISRKHKNDEPQELCNIFPASEIKEIGFYCKDPRNIGTNTNIVVCDIEFYLKTDEAIIKEVVSKNERCAFKRVGDKLEWEEPGIVIMVRAIMDQMLRDELNHLVEKLDRLQMSDRMIRSEGLMMLHDTYNKEELNERYELLKDIMSHCEDEELRNAILNRLKEAYCDLDKNLLIQKLKK